MRLAFVLNTSGEGGAESRLFDFLQSVDRSAVDTLVIALKPLSTLSDRFLALDPVSVAGPTPASVWRLWRVLREWRPDVVHLYGLRANILVRPMNYLLRMKIASALVSANPFRSRLQISLDRVTAPLVDRWLANSEEAKLLAVRTLRINPDRVDVVRSGIDTERFHPEQDRGLARAKLGIPGGSLVVVMVANLRPMKGHLTVVDAISLVSEAAGACTFLFVGGDELGGEIQRYARAQGVSDNIMFAGYQEDVRPFLGAADVFILASTHESFPTSILEAMSTGLPVVATRVGGVPELVVEGQTGLLIPPADSRALAAAIAQLSLDPEFGRELGCAGRRRVVSEYSLQRTVHDYLAVYAALAGRSSISPSTSRH